MKSARLIFTFFVTLACFSSTAIAEEALVRSHADFFDITFTGSDIGYGIGGNIHYDNPQAPPWSTFVVGAQINAHAMGGSHQHVWGVASEAFARKGSKSILVGNESSTINEEPDNDKPKYAYYATFKNRFDPMYSVVLSDPMNANSVALNIESQPGTGFERGIAFRKNSLHPSRLESAPIAIDFSEIPMERMQNIVLVRFPDGWCEYYLGQGKSERRPCEKILMEKEPGNK